jgi:hypothetical protein
LDNSYHGGTGCDSNATYSWFIGMKASIDSDNVKDNHNASFVIMYNNTPEMEEEHKHELDDTQWNVVFEVDTSGVVDI